MPVTGKGRRKVLVVAESPGKEEDKCNTQLIGKSGQRLRSSLRSIGVDLDEDCWKTNSVICYSDKIPSDKEIRYCYPHLRSTIEELNPSVILLLGGTAVKSLIGHEWKMDVGPIGRWVGWKIPCRSLNAWICPSWHPSYLLRQGDEVLDLWFDRHLRKCFSLRGTPYPFVPFSYEEEVRVVMDSDKAAKILRLMLQSNKGPVAFDYETNALKPETKGAAIYSCAMSWRVGDRIRTMAYPWVREAVDATGEVLHSPLPKIAHNMKFEDRWTRKQFGKGVRNWYWDTMLNAHILDNRPGITSLKFQAFVRLGQRDYDSHMKRFFDAKKDGLNRIAEADVRSVLKYNGMDARLTFDLAENQMRDFGETRD
ncbi:MAG: uracil-DNA glycosylase family protein [Candidatus Methanospirareceae archaeon]